MAIPQTGGGLTVDPQKRKWQLGTDKETLLKQQERLQRKKQNNPDDPRFKKRLKKVNKALGALAADPGNEADQPVSAYDQVGDSSNAYLNDLISQMQGQGAFNPGDYSQQREAAYNSVMDQFERTQGQQFAREQDRLRNQMISEGLQEGSQQYKTRMDDLMKTQGDLRQNAMNQAFQLGQGEQAQAYNQAYTTYQSPISNINAMTPFYNIQANANLQQGQQSWQAAQNAFDRALQMKMQSKGFKHDQTMAGLQNQYALQQMAAAPRPSGGLSFDQQMALIDRKYYNDLVAQGGGGGGSGAGIGSGFAAGVGQGIGAGLGSALV